MPRRAGSGGRIAAAFDLAAIVAAHAVAPIGGTPDAQLPLTYAVLLVGVTWDALSAARWFGARGARAAGDVRAREPVGHGRGRAVVGVFRAGPRGCPRGQPLGGARATPSRSLRTCLRPHLGRDPGGPARRRLRGDAVARNGHRAPGRADHPLGGVANGGAIGEAFVAQAGARARAVERHALFYLAAALALSAIAFLNLALDRQGAEGAWAYFAFAAVVWLSAVLAGGRGKRIETVLVPVATAASVVAAGVAFGDPGALLLILATSALLSAAAALASGRWPVLGLTALFHRRRNSSALGLASDRLLPAPAGLCGRSRPRLGSADGGAALSTCRRTGLVDLLAFLGALGPRRSHGTRFSRSGSR